MFPVALECPSRKSRSCRACSSSAPTCAATCRSSRTACARQHVPAPPIVAYRVRLQSPYLFPVEAEGSSRHRSQWVAELAGILAVTDARHGQTACPHTWSRRCAPPTCSDKHRVTAAALLERRAHVPSGSARWREASRLRRSALAGRDRCVAHRRVNSDFIAEGGNAVGGYLAGAVPHRDAGGRRVSSAGLSAAEMLRKPQKAYVLFGGVEPWVEYARRRGAEEPEVRRARRRDHAVRQRCRCARSRTCCCPWAHSPRRPGTYVNLEGLWQSFAGAAAPYRAGTPGLEDPARARQSPRASTGSSTSRPRTCARKLQRSCGVRVPQPYEGQHARERRTRRPVRSLDLNMYQVDAIVRRAPSLQRTREGRMPPATY